MKTKFLTLLFVFAIGLFTSCNNDDDTVPAKSIDGIWKVKNATGGFIPIDIDYNPGDVTWTFNQTSKTLLIENNILTTGPEDIYALLDSGTYKYEIEAFRDLKSLRINDNTAGIITLSNDNLKIDSGADGYIIEFER